MFDQLSLFVNGEWLSKDRPGEDVINPATENVLGHLPHATEDDLDAALDAANAAFPVWRDTPASQRASILKKTASLMRERIEEMAKCLTLESGKPISEARIEVAFAAEILDWYAEEGKRAYGRQIPSRIPGVSQIVLKEPLGPCVAFTPWNVPATTPARKIGGALAAGCTCIIKPSEETPATALAIANAFKDAGLPNGVLNVVFGKPAVVSTYLISSPIIRKVSFTGSIPVGKELARLASDRMIRTTMELGGHAPVIVMPDANPEKAAEAVAINKYRNAGQICIAPSRFFAHESIHDRFVERFTEVSNSLIVKQGIEEGCQIGALANRRRLEAMESFAEDAVEKGAKVTCGGRRIGNRGFFFPPTVFADVPENARMVSEEIFGPLVPIMRFSTFDEVVTKANSLPYGLAAYAFTNSQRTAFELSSKIEAGMVGINHTFIFTPETPFGGIKESGYGSEGGIEGLEAYLTPKFVSQMPL